MSGGPVPYNKKFTAASRGIWNKLRELLIPVANRSSGNPIVGIYRTPEPGSQPHNGYLHDVGTVPAVDIAENRYFNRDWRRNYPQTSVFDQSTVAGLLKYGSVASPRIAKGDEGNKELALVANGELSLTQTLNETGLKDVLDENGLPPLPGAFNHHRYTLLKFEQHGMYDEKYPVRMFH